mmetsp:Transcript_35632/g.42555  ORF Transcript_35632/g.42555 Transcript_35632/m.42555 type:complete len:206 (+) Transcript_35632:251-868(+)
MALTNAQRHKEGAKVLMISHKRAMAGTLGMSNIAIGDEPNDIGMKEKGNLSNQMMTRFKLVTAMGNSGDFANARPLIDEGLALLTVAIRDIEQQMQELGYDQNDSRRDEEVHLFVSTRKSLMDCKIYLLVAKSRCATNIADMARFAIEAVTTGPQQMYARDHAQNTNDIVRQITESGLNPKDVVVIWEASADGETGTFGFALKTM